MEEEEIEPPQARPRSFTGFSGSIGFRRDLGSQSALVANFTGSSRAPALEELYNFGPHVGNLAFEIGNPDLEKETTIGLDLGVRSQSDRVSGGVNFYYYDIKNFVFPSFTDEVVDGLRVAPFLQGDSRFAGVDGEATFNLHEHALLNVDLGYVSAKLTETDEFLPRIPPLHGRISLEMPFGGLNVRPELVWAAKQGKVFRDETTTDGYTVFHINASYLLAQRDLAHVFSARAYNLTNELYRIHTSFIKDVAPEIGRGIKFTYTVQFF
jgi:iron complex outermembrane receptor protein